MGSFNWRLKYPNLKIDEKTNNVICTVQVWDRDLLKSNDFICDYSFPITESIREIYNSEKRVKIILNENINDQKNDQYWVDMKVYNTEDKKYDKKGSVKMSFELLTNKDALTMVNGNGRADPNCEPWLPPRVGRFKWTLNPIELFKQMLGPAFRKKLLR